MVLKSASVEALPRKALAAARKLSGSKATARLAALTKWLQPPNSDCEPR